MPGKGITREETIEVLRKYLPEKAEKTTKKKCFHCGKFITNILGRKGKCAYRDDNCRPVDKDEMEVMGLIKRVDIARGRHEWQAHAEVSDFQKVLKNTFCGYESGAWLNPQGKLIGIRTTYIEKYGESKNYHVDCFYEALTQKYGKDWKKEYEYQTALEEHLALQFPSGRRTDPTGMMKKVAEFPNAVERTIAARKIQRWFRRDVRHKLSDPTHPAGFAFMIRGMKELDCYDEVEIAALELEYKLKRQAKQTKDFFKAISKSSKKIAKQVAKTK